MTEMKLTSRPGGAVNVSFEPPEGGKEQAAGEFRPTVLMERIEAHLANPNAPCHHEELLSGVTGNKGSKSKALVLLVAEGKVEQFKIGQARAYRLVKVERSSHGPSDSRGTPPSALVTDHL